MSSRIFREGEVIALIAPIGIKLCRANAVAVLNIVCVPPLTLSNSDTYVEVRRSFIFVGARSFLFVVEAVRSVNMLGFFSVRVGSSREVTRAGPMAFQG